MASQPALPFRKSARKVVRWGLLWRDSERQHIVMDNCLPALFQTRAAARRYAAERYGYIKDRPHLRSAPLYWRVPEPVRVSTELHLPPHPALQTEAE